MMTVKITPNDKTTGQPAGKLADAELHFLHNSSPSNVHDCQLAACSPLAGLKLIGFGIWERRTGDSRNVTFPARQYSVNGERRSFSLLRPIADATAQDRIREAILDAYAEYEAQAAVAV